MSERFDQTMYFRRVRGVWKPIATAVGIALVLSVAVSLLLPKRYTATASLIIDPPAGNDPRAATAVSPVYLESLKTYVRVASSDTLFVHALQQCAPEELHSGRGIEALKRKILQVSKPQSTKILEIRATLGNARAAQALAAYVAQETVRLSERIDSTSEAEVTEIPRKIAAAAEARLHKVVRDQEEFLRTDTLGEDEDGIYRDDELKAEINIALVRVQTDLAGYLAAGKAGAGATSADEPQLNQTPSSRQEIASARARAAELTRKKAEVDTALIAHAKEIQHRKHREEALEADEKSARAEYDSANSRLNETLASAAFRSERLHVLDLGVVPERPSSPNLLLNVCAAMVLALLGCFFYVGFRAVDERSDAVSKLLKERQYANR